MLFFLWGSEFQKSGRWCMWSRLLNQWQERQVHPLRKKLSWKTSFRTNGAKYASFVALGLFVCSQPNFQKELFYFIRSRRILSLIEEFGEIRYWSFPSFQPELGCSVSSFFLFLLHSCQQLRKAYFIVISKGIIGLWKLDEEHLQGFEKVGVIYKEYVSQTVKCFNKLLEKSNR